MNIESAITKSSSFIVSQMTCSGKSHDTRPPSPGPSITLSQQTGSGAHDIAECTARILQQTEPDGTDEWKVFDRQLVEEALRQHHLPVRLAKYMPEDRRSYIQEVVEELFGLRPPSWVLVPRVAETILRLIKAGHVIVVGRGATAIASQMSGVFHVRLVASLPSRIGRVRQLHNLTWKESALFIEKEDRGSQRYMKAHFGARIEDESLYHLIINTDRIPCANAARLIAEEARRCFDRDRDIWNTGRGHGGSQTASLSS